MEPPVSMGDKKNKLLEMMSIQFNSPDIGDVSAPAGSTKRTPPKVPRLIRKRKFGQIEETEKDSETPQSQNNNSSTTAAAASSPVTSALKKVRKEGIESPTSLPTATLASSRSRRSIQENKFGSEKDSSEDTASISEASEADSKAEDNAEKSSNNKGKKKALKGKGKESLESGLENDSETESQVGTNKSRGKQRSNSEEGVAFESPKSGTTTSLGKGRGKGRGLSDGRAESLPSVGRGSGRGRGTVKEELNSETKGCVKPKQGNDKEDTTKVGKPVTAGRGRGRPPKLEENKNDDSNKGLSSGIRGRGRPKKEKQEDPGKSITPTSTGRGRGRPKLVNDDSGSTNSSPVTPVGRKGRGRALDTDGTPGLDSPGQQRRSVTPQRGETTPVSEGKRSHRLISSRDSSLESPAVGKRGKQLTLPELVKRQEGFTAVKSYPSRTRKEETETLAKAVKKKKKHFKGLSYSFIRKKKKNMKTKQMSGSSGLDTSQETDSVVSEEIDAESVDSSSQDVPSEQLSQDQDGLEDMSSEVADNDDADMDNLDTVDTEQDNEDLPDIQKPSADPGEDEDSMDVEHSAVDSVVHLNATDDSQIDTEVAEYDAAEPDEGKANAVLEDESQISDADLVIDTSVVTHEEEFSDDHQMPSESVEETSVVEDKTEDKDDDESVSPQNQELTTTEACNEEEEDEKVCVESLAEGATTDEMLRDTESKNEDEEDQEQERENGEEVEEQERENEEEVQEEEEEEQEQQELQEEEQRQQEQEEEDDGGLGEEGSLAVENGEEEAEAVDKTPENEEEHHIEDQATDASPTEMDATTAECSREPSEVRETLDTEERIDQESLDPKEEGVACENGILENETLVGGDEEANSEPSKPELEDEEPVAQEEVANSDLTVPTLKEPCTQNDGGSRYQSRRRHSISKRRLDELGLEGHTSDSSDSLGEVKSGLLEGVRKSKRLSRTSSPHPLAIAAPKSPDDDDGGRSQSKPTDSQHVNVADPNLINVLCKCRSKENPEAIGITGEKYCEAIDSFDGRMIGCCNIVNNHRYLRVSGKIPFALLCEIHRQRLRRHNCCPCCGLFCTQGVFYECSWNKAGPRHYFHKLCGLLVGGMVLCPHCGSQDPPTEVLLELKLVRKPVIYLKQHQERKEASARMTWSKEVAPESEHISPQAASVEEPSLTLRSGHVISATSLSQGLVKEKLQEAIRSINSGKVLNIKPSAKGIYWAVKNNDVEKLLYVLANGIHPNIRVKEYGNQTGLHVAASFGVLAALHVLVLAGATIDMTDTQLMTPLMVAIIRNQNDIVQYLIQAGTSLMAKTQDGMTCLHLAAKCGNLTACQHILDSGRLSRHSVNIQDEGGWTPLVWASENKFISVVKFLLDRGGNPQLCDVEQNTALHWAAFSGSTHICSMVLDRGCSLRSMNAHGDTPLHIAARQNHMDAVILLLSRGAQLDIVNTKGQTPTDCAIPESEVHLQLTLNIQIIDMMHQNNIRTEKILSSDIAAGKEQVPIPCVNGEDDDVLPKDYLYIAENCEASNVIIDRTVTSLKWCECEDSCNTEQCGCCQLNFQCWYDPDGRLLPEFNYADPPMIFECNRACRCNKLSCNNRVVQHGISAHMQLFKTVGKGWGVRALKTIQKGSYVCEYVGEIITDLEADQRQDDSYLFDLDNRDSETFCIDARGYGNIARFINHLCEPNLTPVKIFIDHQDLTFPRIAFFANRDIEADEELGFDYGEKFWIIKYKHFTCTCSSEKCKFSSKTIHTTLENYNQRIRESQEAS